MNEDAFRNHLRRYRLKKEDIDFGVKAVTEFEEYLEEEGTSFESAGLEALKNYVSLLIKNNKNSMERLVAIARYCHIARKNDYYIYFTSILNARNILPDLGERLATIAGEKARRRIFHGFELPPLGAPPESYTGLTKTIVDRMEAELPRETCKHILTWNYHKVPTEVFKEEKERFDKAESIDQYLRDEHKGFIEELNGFMKKRRIWYEQEITPEVLGFVKNNQKICTGVRSGEKIFVTKIPYAPKQYLKEKDSILKRYYACHCPLVRSAIRDRKPKISPMFCHCSNGYVKVRFDTIFGEPVGTELLESVLKGDMCCSFAIKIPKAKMK